MPKSVQKMGNSSSGPICEQEDIQSPSVFQCRPVRFESLGRRCTEGEMTTMPEILLSTPKPNTPSHEKTSEVGRGTNYGHTLFVK